MKAIGLCLVAVTGLLCGLFAALHLKQRVKTLTLAVELLAFLQSRIRYTAAPFSALLCEAAAQERFAALTFLQQTAQLLTQGQTVPQAWQNSVKSLQRQDGLTREDQALLLHLGDDLGRTDTSGQTAHLTLYCQQLEQTLVTARDTAKTKGTLYRTLGLCAGAAAALLLW